MATDEDRPGEPGGVADEHRDVVAAAEALLSRRFGGQQRALAAEDLGGSGAALVLRLRLAASPFLQDRTVVVKSIPVTDDELDDAALVREVVAYQFATSLPEASRPGPTVLAYDIAERIIVLSDLGDARTFAELMAEPEGRIGHLRSVGQALGSLHAATAEREGEFESLRSLMARRNPKASAINQYRQLAHHHAIEWGAGLLKDAGIAVPDPVRELLESAGRRLRRGLRAFSPGDLSPDNIVSTGRARFLDYEWGRFRDVSFDIASIIVDFPQYPGVAPLTEEEVGALISAWHREADERVLGGAEPAVVRAIVADAVVALAVSAVAEIHAGDPHNLVAELANRRGFDAIGVDEGLKLSLEGIITGEPAAGELADAARRRLGLTALIAERVAAAAAEERGGDERLAAGAELAGEIARRVAERAAN